MPLVGGSCYHGDCCMAGPLIVRGSKKGSAAFGRSLHMYRFGMMVMYSNTRASYMYFVPEYHT